VVKDASSFKPLPDYFFFFDVSFVLYVVSAMDELPAFPGAADGGSTPLLAAESGPAELTDLTESVCAAGVLELLLQEDEKRAVKKKATIYNFFI